MQKAVGYIALPAHVADPAGYTAEWRRRFSNFGIMQRISILGVFVDDPHSHGAAFGQMIATLKSHGASAVIVPYAAHLSRRRDGKPSDYTEAFRAQLGAHVREVGVRDVGEAANA